MVPEGNQMSTISWNPREECVLMRTMSDAVDRSSKMTEKGILNLATWKSGDSEEQFHWSMGPERTGEEKQEIPVWTKLLSFFVNGKSEMEWQMELRGM